MFGCICARQVPSNQVSIHFLRVFVHGKRKNTLRKLRKFWFVPSAQYIANSVPLPSLMFPCSPDKGHRPNGEDI